MYINRQSRDFGRSVIMSHPENGYRKATTIRHKQQQKECIILMADKSPGKYAGINHEDKTRPITQTKM